ncbi:MAG: ubiquinol-cytochrome C chaperone family protein [Pseudomonadota bacterium]
MQSLYQEIVQQSRHPVFYKEWGVPDSVDGRFDMISLHCAIMIYRIQKTGDKKLSQILFDVFFKTMDRTLREMGIGDLSVPKHMKRMMQGFNGRMIRYAKAIENEDDSSLEDSIRRNVYGTIEDEAIEQDNIRKMAQYFKNSCKMDGIEPVFAEIITKDNKNAA